MHTRTRTRISTYRDPGPSDEARGARIFASFDRSQAPFQQFRVYTYNRNEGATETRRDMNSVEKFIRNRSVVDDLSLVTKRP